jgi:hypothetical protein
MSEPEQARSQLYDKYEVLRAKWHAEDELINHRITWLLVSESLLFSAFAALYYARATALAPFIISSINFSDKQNVVRSTIIVRLDCDLADATQALPILGIIMSFLIWVSICGAIIAMQVLDDKGTYIRV